MTSDPELPPEVDERVRAELHDLHVLDRAAAPDPEHIVATMRANGLDDPEREHRGGCGVDGCPRTYAGSSREDVLRQHQQHMAWEHQQQRESREREAALRRLGLHDTEEER